jgi:hypothetical protein
MHYQISNIDDIASITFQGNLNAFDLLFMLQSQEYKTTINSYKKILIDYTQVDGVTLTAEDVKSLALLSRIDLENLGSINIVLVVDGDEQKLIKSVTQSLFSTSKSNVQVVDSRDKAMKILIKT